MVFVYSSDFLCVDTNFAGIIEIKCLIQSYYTLFQGRYTKHQTNEDDKYRVRQTKCNQLHAIDVCLLMSARPNLTFSWFIVLFTIRGNHFVFCWKTRKKSAMEFKRNSVVALYLAGKSQPAIQRYATKVARNKQQLHRKWFGS